MIRCDNRLPSLEGKREARARFKIVCTFFFPLIIDSISDAESDRANDNERLPRAHTDRVILSFFLRATHLNTTPTPQRWRAVFASHGLAKIESFD